VDVSPNGEGPAPSPTAAAPPPGDEAPTETPRRPFNTATPDNPSDTVGTGSSVAVACSVLTLLAILLGIAVILLARLF
jgi:hypothetical protein